MVDTACFSRCRQKKDSNFEMKLNIDHPSFHLGKKNEIENEEDVEKKKEILGEPVG